MLDARRAEVTGGRVATVRLAPNEDVTDGLERAATAIGFAWALVRSGLGSLVDATLAGPHDARRTLAGPGVEVLALSGELRPGDADCAGITAILGATDGRVDAGSLVRGGNLVCVTLEAVLEELIPTHPHSKGRSI